MDSVNDGIDAVERMKDLDENTYDLILMDIQMPKMDGYTATKEIRHLSNRRKANIPIVAMTANAFEEDKKKSMAAGMNAHLSKPVNIQKSSRKHWMAYLKMISINENGSMIHSFC